MEDKLMLLQADLLRLLFANQKREIEEGLVQRCPYCRELVPEMDEEIEQNFMKRAKADDPVALCQMGAKCYENQGDFKGAVEYLFKAAAMGDFEAHFNLSIMYAEGKGVEKDTKKEVYHLEEAAIGGHPEARYNLGCYEGKNKRHDRAKKHYIIAAKLGDDDALEVVKEGFAAGLVSKDEYAAALRGHQAAVDATKSAQREEAYAFYNRIGYKE
jgi:tetratricopeptide (TPR) repeat protein